MMDSSGLGMPVPISSNAGREAVSNSAILAGTLDPSHPPRKGRGGVVSDDWVKISPLNGLFAFPRQSQAPRAVRAVTMWHNVAACFGHCSRAGPGTRWNPGMPGGLGDGEEIGGLVSLAPCFIVIHSLRVSHSGVVPLVISKAFALVMRLLAWLLASTGGRAGRAG